MTQLWTGHAAEAVASLERAAARVAQQLRDPGKPRRCLPRARRGGEGGTLPTSVRSPSPAPSSTSTRTTSRPAPTCATGLAKTGHAAEARAGDGTGPRARPERCPKSSSDAAIVAALAGRDAEALDWLRKAVAAGYCREIIAAAARVRPLPRQSGVSFDRRRAAQGGRLLEGGDHGQGITSTSSPWWH